MRKYSKGYYNALEDANGDESKIRHSYGWYSITDGTQYDDDGETIPFT